MNCRDIPQWRLRHAAIYANTVYRLCTACMNFTVGHLAGKRALEVEYLS